MDPLPILELYKGFPFGEHINVSQSFIEAPFDCFQVFGCLQKSETFLLQGEYILIHDNMSIEVRRGCEDNVFECFEEQN